MTVNRTLGRALGLFSLGLGTIQLMAPRRFAHAIGMRRYPTALVRVVGLREIAAGVALLAARRTSGPLWSRVGGDLMDLTILGFTFRRGGRLATDGRMRDRLTAATAATVGITATDLVASVAASRERDAVAESPTTEHAERGGRVRVRRSITVDRPVEEVYRFWRDLENLPRFMRHLESVRVLDNRRSIWRAWAPGGKIVEWEAEVVADLPNERIAWRALPGSQVRNEGDVTFRTATGGRGTVVTAELEYEPPAGILGARIARIFGQEPTQQVPEDLRRFKQVIETGEVTLSDATRTTTGLKQRAAQPGAEAGAREAFAGVASAVASPFVGAAVGGRERADASGERSGAASSDGGAS